MQSILAVLVLSVSIAVPEPNPHNVGCFNSSYPAPVTAEDGTTITCPAVYYADTEIAVPVIPVIVWSRYNGIR